MDLQLTSTTELVISQLGLAFNGYAYAPVRWPGQESQVQQLIQRLRQQGWLPEGRSDCFAMNFFLHRNFYANGQLPTALTSDWYAMLWLFLHLYREPVPVEWRHESLYRGWATRPAPEVAAAATEARHIIQELRADTSLSDNR